MAFGVDGEPIGPGRVYVAPPDHHMVVHGDRIRLRSGPRENRVRPAIDPLFRTAARWFGERVVGVALSGVLDDGATGMAAVKARGGVVVAQAPEDALYAGIPRSVIERVGADHVAPADDLAEILVALVVDPDESSSVPPVSQDTGEGQDASLDEQVHAASDMARFTEERGKVERARECAERRAEMLQEAAAIRRVLEKARS